MSVFVYGPSLLGPFAGMLADRVRRRPLLLVVNLGAAALMVPMVLVHPVWLIYVVMLGYGFVAVLIDSAESALFAVMLPAPVRVRFNGLRLTLQEGGKLVAPLLGAGLFAVLGFALPWTFLAVLNLSQSRTPDELQGRVAAVVGLALFAPQPLAHALGAFAVAHVSYRWLYLGVAAVFMALAWRLASRPTPSTPPGQP
jgi:MFS family permease